MKHISAKQTLALLMTAATCSVCLFKVPAAAYDNKVFEVCKTETAPVIDGVVSDGEYKLVASYADGSLTLSPGSKLAPVAEFYATWDDQYFYYAAKVTCQQPHSAPRDDSTEHWIFNGHNMMCALIPEDPEQDKYISPSGELAWGWGDLYESGICHEWTTILSSITNEVDTANHFLAMTESEGFQTSVTSKDGFDTYETRIAFSQISTQSVPQAFEAKDGAVFGFDFNIGLTDVGAGDGEISGDYIYLGDMYTGDDGKQPHVSSKIVLSDQLITAEDIPAAEPETSTDNPSAPLTGDAGMTVGAILTAAAAAGIVAFRKNKKREF